MSNKNFPKDFQEIKIEDIQAIAKVLIQRHEEFSCLKKVDLKFVYMQDNPESYFKTFFSIWTKLNPFLKNEYIIYMNKDINKVLPISFLAVEGIMVHELFHIRDYVKAWPWDLVKLGLDYGAKYERKTDRRAARLGYAQGLIEYREWLYPLMPDQEAIDKKHEFYLTPEELKEYLKTNEPA